MNQEQPTSTYADELAALKPQDAILAAFIEVMLCSCHDQAEYAWTIEVVCRALDAIDKLKKQEEIPELPSPEMSPAEVEAFDQFISGGSQ